MVVAGISTIGTQAAAEFETSKDCMRAIASFLGNPSANSDIPLYFQVLLHVQIRDGEDAKTSCVFVRKLAFKPQTAPSVRQDASANSAGSAPHP